MSQPACIKSEPTAFQEDQEDLLMSYLNSDYMSTSSPPTCWNTTSNNHIAPPTPSSTPTLVQSPVSIPDIRQSFFDIVSPSSSSATGSAWNHLPDSPTTSDNYSTQQASIIQEFPFLFSNNSHQHPLLSYSGHILYNQASSQFPQPFFAQQLQQPASPPASSCSSDGEQPKKRRGRKKRDSCTSSSATTSPPPLTPAIIAPAAPVPKQLATILPAVAPNNQQEERGSALIATSCYGNTAAANSKCTTAATTSIVTPALATSKKEDLDQHSANNLIDSQKAATIAKRQERLIKNRAAALLSRKRKREHLTALEDQRTGLTNENNALKEKVMQLEKENLELKNKLDFQQGCDNKTTMIFMVRKLVLCVCFL